MRTCKQERIPFYAPDVNHDQYKLQLSAIITFNAHTVKPG